MELGRAGSFPSLLYSMLLFYASEIRMQRCEQVKQALQRGGVELLGFSSEDRLCRIGIFYDWWSRCSPGNLGLFYLLYIKFAFDTTKNCPIWMIISFLESKETIISVILIFVLFLQTFWKNFATKYELQLKVFFIHSTIENYMFLESCWFENINHISFNQFCNIFAQFCNDFFAQHLFFHWTTCIYGYHNSKERKQIACAHFLHNFAKLCKNYFLSWKCFIIFEIIWSNILSKNVEYVMCVKYF